MESIPKKEVDKGCQNSYMVARFGKNHRFMTGKAKILIIEDEMPLALLMVSLLSRAGCEVEVATTAKKGILLAEEGNFDLITLDVDLPDANGFKICSRLKENPRLRDTPVVFVSGHSCLEDQQHGLELGAVDYIEKPFGSLDFVSRVLSHIKTRETQEKAMPRVFEFGNLR
jgi:putative two-component system response regulator